MPTVTLGDGSPLHFEDPVTVSAVLQKTNKELAKKALAGKVNGRVVDLSYLIVYDAAVQVITDQDPEGLEILRHSCAHLLAHAVKELYPTTQVTIGPVIEEGFYYDFSFERPFTPEDLVLIEKRMQEIVKRDLPVNRFLMTREEGVAFFLKLGEQYKAKIIEDIPADETISLYRQGEFVDLCRGPHVPSTGRLKAFKLTRVAGAYWRGDSNNEMLQRIYGTAWASRQDLDTYLTRLEEAEKRDHRKLGKLLDLFHTQDEAPGMVFWHPKGWSVYQIIEQYMRNLWRENGYQEVRTPQMVDRSLWEKSGHWEKFGDEMFVVELESRTYAIKPMNCPCHIQIFNQALTSYRELPLRFAEFGCCHRHEPSGALHGLMRVRGFTQDDGHIFCAEEDIQSEVSTFIDLLYKIYADFGFHEVIIKLSTRPAKRVGSDAIWDKAEHALSQALDTKGLTWQLQPGEGAFYGPKIEFSLKDCLGRVWQCGTMQVDFFMPERLGAYYIGAESQKCTPVMLHRAVLGSCERFIGILLEHYAGLLPLWLSPVQAVVMTITDRQAEYANEIAKKLKKSGFRAISDLRNEKIGFKIREHTLQKIPYLLVVGDKELESNAVAVRTHQGRDLGSLSLEALIELLGEQVATRK